MPLHIYVPCWGVAKTYFRPNMGNGEFHDAKVESEGNGALHIHEDAYSQASKISIGLTFKECDHVMHGVKWFKCKCRSMHLHLNYNHCPSWGLCVNEVWILLVH
jgi:hypothetical protein